MGTMDLAIDETVTFILGQIPSPQARILDVGCGDGRVAGRLLAHGHEVVAIDESGEMVQQARTRGVDARVAVWPSFEDTPFDVVLFARSLHHAHPLSESVEQAHRLLVPAGRVIVEDFAWSEIDSVTAEWFYGIVRLLAGSGMLATQEESFVIDLAQSGGEFSFWKQSHDHELHTVTTMWAALRARFRPIGETQMPFLYRYLCPLLPENETGYAIASQVLEMEKRMAQLGAIKRIGRRFVGAKEYHKTIGTTGRSPNG